MGGERIFQVEETKSLYKGLGLGRNLTHSRRAREVARQ